MTKFKRIGMVLAGSSTDEEIMLFFFQQDDLPRRDIYPSGRRLCALNDYTLEAKAFTTSTAEVLSNGDKAAVSG
jgi:hypothetical protein